jgi:hypothetical protein
VSPERIVSSLIASVYGSLRSHRRRTTGAFAMSATGTVALFHSPAGRTACALGSVASRKLRREAAAARTAAVSQCCSAEGSAHFSALQGEGFAENLSQLERLSSVSLWFPPPAVPRCVRSPLAPAAGEPPAVQLGRAVAFGAKPRHRCGVLRSYRLSQACCLTLRCT